MEGGTVGAIYLLGFFFVWWSHCWVVLPTKAYTLHCSEYGSLATLIHDGMEERARGSVLRFDTPNVRVRDVVSGALGVSLMNGKYGCTIEYTTLIYM